MSAPHGPEQPDHDRSSGRARLVRVLVIVLALALVVIGVLLWLHGRNAADDTGSGATRTTSSVTEGAVVDQTVVRGTLAHPAGSPVLAGPAGVLTSLPEPGSTITAGGTLYTVDTRPVVLMTGTVPAYRDLAAGMTPGPDVVQLEQNLADLGYFTGTPDDRFTAATAQAIRAWQRSTGAEQTGRLERTVVVFAPGAVRVDAWSSQVGAQVGPGSPLFTTTGTDKVVQLDLPLADQQLAVVGTTVQVSLPDGTGVAATLVAVGQAVERDASGDSGTVVVPVTATLADQASAAAFAQADVSVAFSATLAEDALTVPVEALLAIDSSTFGVQVVTGDSGPTTLVPVDLGVFAAGRVQVSGEGIAAGTLVVVPGR